MNVTVGIYNELVSMPETSAIREVLHNEIISEIFTRFQIIKIHLLLKKIIICSSDFTFIIKAPFN